MDSNDTGDGHIIRYDPPKEETELFVTFTPDGVMHGKLTNDDMIPLTDPATGEVEIVFADNAPEDIRAFDEAYCACRSIFLARRQRYGSHLEKHIKYHEGLVYAKAVRACHDHEHDRSIDKDTLIDAINFQLFLLSMYLQEEQS